METRIKYNSTKIILIILFLNAIVIACKKKESSPAETTSTTTNTGLTRSTGGDYCNLYTGYRYYDSSGVVKKDSSVFASFYSSPESSVPGKNIAAGSVSLNGTPIPFSRGSYFIDYDVPTSIAGTLNWDVGGSGTVTAFSQSFTASYPKYTGGNILPDTIVKTNGVSINITGMSNTQTSVLISLYGCCGGGAPIHTLVSNGTVTFSPADLSSFTGNTWVILNVRTNNVFSANIGGIKRGFTNGLHYRKYCFLK